MMSTGLQIIQPTQHWFRLHGAWYRDVWVRTPDGRVKLVGILEDVAA